MGAADIVPGVSGGTIALITGIYDRLLRAITSADRVALSLLFRGRFLALLYRVDFAFLAVLGSGILSSVFILANAIHWLIDHQPQPTWAFFSGLILASSGLLIRDEVTLNKMKSALVFSFGVALAVTIGLMPSFILSGGLPSFFFAGLLAISAMILPGISGSFLLLLLGMYSPVLVAVKMFQWQELGVFVAGCTLGLIAFSRLLQRLLNLYRAIAMAFLTGLLCGSLVSVWPWRAERLVSIPLDAEALTFGRPVLPFNSIISDPQFTLCVLFACFGSIFVWSLDWLMAEQRA